MADVKQSSSKQRHRGVKIKENEDRKKKALKLEVQINKKKYSRPIDDDNLDDITNLMTSMGVGKKWPPFGTSVFKFSPLFGTDQQQDSDMERLFVTHLQCITSMKEYEEKSLEELRFDDHMKGHRYRGRPSGKALFRETTWNKDAELNYEWPATSTFEVKFEATKFQDSEQEGEMMNERTCRHQCITSMVEYEGKSLEELRLEDYISGFFKRKNVGFNVIPSKNWHEKLKGLHTWNSDGTQNCEFESTLSRCDEYYMTDRNERLLTSGWLAFVPPAVHLRSITAMESFKMQSFEELRLKDYLAGYKYPRGPMYEASEEELSPLKIEHGAEVCVFIKRRFSETRETGIVKFIGRMPDKVFGKLYVGMELKQPVGEGDGRYKDIRLFKTKPHHAKMAPLASVLPLELFDEFHGDDSDICETEFESSTSLPDERRNCIVCLVNAVEIFLSPCGHACCCNDCARRFTTCPMCRVTIQDRSRVFLS